MPTINFISFEKCKILYFEYKNSRENKKERGQHTGNPAL